MSSFDTACRVVAKSWLVLLKAENHSFLSRDSLSCTPSGARTLDTLIKSQVLYQLS